MDNIVTFSVAGYNIVVDKEDEHLLTEYNWRVQLRKNAKLKKYIYATKNSKNVYLARIIMKLTPKQRIEFIDGNTFNFRKTNLRIMAGIKLLMQNRHKVKGIIYTRNNWIGRIQYGGKKYITARHYKKEDAILAYNKLSVKLRGSLGRQL